MTSRQAATASRTYHPKTGTVCLLWGHRQGVAVSLTRGCTQPLGAQAAACWDVGSVR